MKRFKSWIMMREALSQGVSLPRVASSGYFAQDQKMDDKVFPAAGMDSNLDPAKKKSEHNHSKSKQKVARTPLIFLPQPGKAPTLTQKNYPLIAAIKDHRFLFSG